MLWLHAEIWLKQDFICLSLVSWWQHETIYCTSAQSKLCCWIVDCNVGCHGMVIRFQWYRLANSDSAYRSNSIPFVIHDQLCIGRKKGLHSSIWQISNIYSHMFCSFRFLIKKKSIEYWWAFVLLSKLSLFPLLVFSCPAALQALKRKKRYEKQLTQIDGTLSTIEFQREALENANTNTEVLKNMGFAAQAMKAAHENMYERSSGSISKESFVISSFFFSFFLTVVLAFICHRISVISLFLFFLLLCSVIRLYFSILLPLLCSLQ